MGDTEQWQEISELHEHFKKRIAELQARAEKDLDIIKRQTKRINELEALPKHARDHAAPAKTTEPYWLGWKDACNWIMQSASGDKDDE